MLAAGQQVQPCQMEHALFATLLLVNISPLSGEKALKLQDCGDEVL